MAERTTAIILFVKIVRREWIFKWIFLKLGGQSTSKMLFTSSGTNDANESAST